MSKLSDFYTVGILHFDDGTHAFVDTKGKDTLVEKITAMLTTKKYDTYFKVREDQNKNNNYVLSYVECVDKDHNYFKRIKSIRGRMKHFCVICNTEGKSHE